MEQTPTVHPVNNVYLVLCFPRVLRLLHALDNKRDVQFHRNKTDE